MAKPNIKVGDLYRLKEDPKVVIMVTGIGDLYIATTPIWNPSLLGQQAVIVPIDLKIYYEKVKIKEFNIKVEGETNIIPFSSLRVGDEFTFVPHDLVHRVLGFLTVRNKAFTVYGSLDKLDCQEASRYAETHIKASESTIEVSLIKPSGVKV